MEIQIEPKLENLAVVVQFIEEQLKQNEFSKIKVSQFLIAAEEVYVNIVSYAKNNDKLAIRFWMGENSANLSFVDGGIPFNMLLQKQPELSVEARQNQVGGLGIFMTKQLTDDIKYHYEDGHNILTLIKKKV